MPLDDSSKNCDENTPARPTSRSLVDAFRSGEPAIVEEVRQRAGRIIAFSRYRIPRDDREGLQQEVLIQIWQAVNRDGFDRDRGFWGFVQTVAARRCIDWMRRHRPTLVQDVALADSGRNPLVRVLERERNTALARVLEQLAPACLELIELRMVRGESYTEIARRLGRSEQALRAQMYRCVGKARDLLNESRVDDGTS